MTSILSEKILSRRKCRELFDIRLAGGQQRGNDFAAALRHHITVRAADFAQQSMGPQQPQLAGDGADSPPLLPVRSDLGPESPAKVAVAHPVDGIFAPADRREQGRVLFTPRVERAMAASIFDHSAADARAGLARLSFVRHASQRFQIPPVGCRRHLGPSPGRPAALNSILQGRFAATAYFRCWSGSGLRATWGQSGGGLMWIA